MERKASGRSKWGDGPDDSPSGGGGGTMLLGGSLRASLPRGPSFLGLTSNSLSASASKSDDADSPPRSSLPEGGGGSSSLISSSSTSSLLKPTGAQLNRKSSQLSPASQEKPRARLGGGYQQKVRGRLVSILRCLFVVGTLLACVLSILNLASLLVCDSGSRASDDPLHRPPARGIGRTVLGPGGPWGRGAGSSSALTLSASSSRRKGQQGQLASRTAGQVSGSIGGSPTAVCLVGGARSFEATGPSILKYVIEQYDPCDVFLNAPLDADSAKFLALSPAKNLVGVRVFPNCEVDETQHPTDILQAAGSPQGCQGLLQYFRLVEGCLEMILRHEKESRVLYEWIVRARVDAYWRGPAPPLSSFSRDAYNIPYGNDFHGYNDRFGAGLHRQAEVSMRRLSLMTAIKIANQSTSHNSEKAYKMQFVLNGVEIARAHVPFCVLTHRLPNNITAACDPAVPSLATELSMDGTKCMPCQLCDSRPDEKAVMAPLYTYMSLVKHSDGTYEGSSLIQVCNLTDVWTPGLWEKRFDAAVGAEMADHRRSIMAISHDQCIQKLAEMERKTLRWEGPPPVALCLRKMLGSTAKIGEGEGAFLTFRRLISPSSVVIAARLKDEGDRSWEMEIQRVTGAKVLVWYQADLAAFSASLAALGATKVDILKFSAEGHDTHWLSKCVQEEFVLPVCQLLVTFPRKATPTALLPALTGGLERIAGYVHRAGLEKIHLQLESCIGGQGGMPDRCLFFSSKYCL